MFTIRILKLWIMCDMYLFLVKTNPELTYHNDCRSTLCSLERKAYDLFISNTYTLYHQKKARLIIIHFKNASYCELLEQICYIIFIWVYWSIKYFFLKDVTVIDWWRTWLGYSIQATIWRWADSANSKTRGQEASNLYAGWSCQILKMTL